MSNQHSSSGPLGTATILVIGVEDALRDLARVILTSSGYQVLEAADPAEALHLAESYTGPIYLALLDAILPLMDGAQLAERLRVLRPNMKFVFMSGYNDPPSMRYGNRGVQGAFLSRSFSPEVLIATVREALGGRRTVLVVEDDPAVRDLILKGLAPGGFNLMEASDGKQALKRIRESDVDMLVTDLVMPEMDGLELIKVIRKERPNVRIIAISGMFDGRFLPVAEYLGAHATLYKPFASDDVLAAVTRVLKQQS